MGTTQEMSRFIVNSQYEDIPEPAIELAKLCLLDIVGCAIYATTRPLGKIMIGLIEELGGKPVARVLGTRIETNAVNAALANGTLGHAEDFDDMGTGAHHAALLMPVVLGLGEESHTSGKQALTAYLVGFDITANISLNIGSDHYGKGWHGTSSIGTLGTTAAASKMLGLDEMQTRMALGIGASQAAGLRANFGTMTKPFHPGNAARSGIMAAKMAQKDYEANLNIMEHRFGYAAVYGEQMTQLANMTRHLGNPWAIMGTGRDIAKGAEIKIWPCCANTHPGITGIIRLLKDHPFKPADVESVDIATTHNPSSMPANIRWPASGLQGKFSVWYTVASVIVDGGRVDFSSFTDEAVKRPAVQELLPRVNIVQDRDTMGRPHRALGGEAWWDITINLKNGERLNTWVERYGDTFGWEHREAVIEKFKMTAGAVLKPTQVDAALNAIMAIEKVSDIRDVMDTVTLSR